MAAAASTHKASRARSKQHVASPHDQQTTAGDVAPLAAVATPQSKQSTRQPRKKRRVAQAGKPASIPRGDAGANPATPTISPAKHPGGRKSKRTPATVAKIVKALSAGLPHELACKYAGIGKSTFYQWMQDDAAFEARVQQSEGAAALKWADIIDEAAVENWQAAAWKLERRYPEMFGRKVQTQEQRGEVQHTLRIVYVDDWRAKQPALDEPQIIDAEKAS